MKDVIEPIQVQAETFTVGELKFEAPSPAWIRCLRHYGNLFKFVIGTLNGTPAPWLIYPLRNQQRTIDGFYARSIKPAESRAPFDFQHYHSFGEIPFFNPDHFQWGPTLFQVEGLLDTLSTGLWCPSVVGNFSNAMNNHQIEWLTERYKEKKFKRIVIIRDHDVKEDGRDPGKVGALASLKKLERIGIPATSVRTPFGAKDPGDLFGSELYGDFINNYLGAVQ